MDLGTQECLEPAIDRGIKAVAVGKKGSKPLSPQLVDAIVQDLLSGKVSGVACGAFFAGLCAKGIAPHEEKLYEAFGQRVMRTPEGVLNILVAEAPWDIQELCRQLLRGSTLNTQEARDLGRYLFSDQPSDTTRGWIASFLRVRYTTQDEYAGLLCAMHETLLPIFKTKIAEGDPILQIAEPFDGVDHGHMITPLIGKHLQTQGYRVAHQIGNSSGPKFEMNLWDIVQALGIKPHRSAADLNEDKPLLGWFFHQAWMSPSLERWVALRRGMIKRMFLSTLERFINPFAADFLIASAFHAPYAEKMIAIAEYAGFKHIIIVRNGIEGSVAFPLLRPVKMLLSVQGKDGSFKRHEMTIEPTCVVRVEERIEKPKALDNACLIQRYCAKGTSGSIHFDKRLEITTAGLDQALRWLKENAL